MAFEQEAVSLQDQFNEAIASNDKLIIQDFLNNQNISDVAQLISDNEAYETQIISILSPHRAVSTFKILDVPEQKRIIKSLPPLKTAELLNELPADDRTAFLEELSTGAVRELIKLLDPEERKITLSLLGYPEGSVGRLMIPDYIAVHEDWTVEEVLHEIRTEGKHIETIDVVYIINEKGAFVDDIRIREIILASPDTILADIIDRRFIALNVHDNQEEANNIFKMNNRVALPVVDDNNILLGIVTIDDVLWVANEGFTENIQRIGGTEALDEPYLEMPLFKLFRKRAGWLVVLFLGEMLTATAMSYFEDEITKAIVLALFVPLIISSGGNSGSQASTLIIQAMAMGEVYISDWLRVLKREILSGLMLGTVLGAIGFLRIELWSHIFPEVYGVHSFFIALTVGFSLIGVVLWGTISGSMLPLFLKKLGADPAASSAPFVATLVDVTGLVIYFSVAYIFLQGILL
ncbi:magnesium transporter [Agriterribacter sp.]|uniref:magnesium transporter n=1 Tax=Agriterribacter sp. TaxID=2821509 RepID=UPI002BEFB1BC|nr:magnesium transporter [Agriterribacter sp.]HTN06439.1 magnesium transporter [Agriterribacter sp.]